MLTGGKRNGSATASTKSNALRWNGLTRICANGGVGRTVQKSNGRSKSERMLDETIRRRRALRIMNIARCLLILSAALIATTANANLRFCNRTGAKVDVAIASVEKDAPGTSTGGDKGVRVEGWWGVDPSQCAVVSTMHAGNHEVFYFARSSDGQWAGHSWLCVSSSNFDRGAYFKRQGDRCPAGSRLEGFRSMPTRAKNHTHDLTLGH
jgi:uncharacterized membrane protein